jgi:hypothetical protein
MVFLILLIAFIIIDYKYDLYLDITKEQILLWYTSEHERKYYIIWDGNRR